ncbi:hypothetical protein GCK72_012790 [Caenorhabditis remanei]|nr:hypothetical protein GCK72_012790 [Caenorhabditis remanei]KAF1756337.1 hypothetical protein GCK72_012790 [Caenorhabditis remanei]
MLVVVALVALLATVFTKIVLAENSHSDEYDDDDGAENATGYTTMEGTMVYNLTGNASLSETHPYPMPMSQGVTVGITGLIVAGVISFAGYKLYKMYQHRQEDAHFDNIVRQGEQEARAQVGGIEMRNLN